MFKLCILEAGYINPALKDKLLFQTLDQTINTLAMASPFSLEEKQVLLETMDIKNRKIELEKILSTYILDEFNNKTIQ